MDHRSLLGPLELADTLMNKGPGFAGACREPSKASGDLLVQRWARSGFSVNLGTLFFLQWGGYSFSMLGYQAWGREQ